VTIAEVESVCAQIAQSVKAIMGRWEEAPRCFDRRAVLGLRSYCRQQYEKPFGIFGNVKSKIAEQADRATNAIKSGDPSTLVTGAAAIDGALRIHHQGLR
jgi:hypothetical protein